MLVLWTPVMVGNPLSHSPAPVLHWSCVLLRDESSVFVSFVLLLIRDHLDLFYYVILHMSVGYQAASKLYL